MCFPKEKEKVFAVDESWTELMKAAPQVVATRSAAWPTKKPT